MSDLSEIKKLLDDQGHAFNEFKKANDEMLKAKAEGKAVGDLAAKLDKLEKSLTNLDEAKAAIEEIEKKLGRPGFGGDGKAAADLEAEAKGFQLDRSYMFSKSRPELAHAEISVDEYKLYKSGFFKSLRKGGVHTLTADEVKAMNAGTDTDGGFLLPHSTVGRTIKRVYETSPIRQIASVQMLSTESLEGILDLDEADAGWVGETDDRPDTATPGVKSWQINAHELWAQPKATQKLLDDAAVDIEAWLADKVADKFARLENQGFVKGDGVKRPRGFAAYDTVTTGDDTRTWGKLQHVLSGADGAFVASPNQADVLFDLIGSFKEYFLANARWVTRREVITLVRKFKNSQGDYLWQPSLVAGQPDKLIDYPITIAQDMPALAADSLSLAFGDFREGYQIIDRQAIRTLRDPYTAKPFVRFYSTKRVGGGVVNFEAIKFLKFGD